MKGIAEFEGEIDEDGLRNEVAASLALEVEDKQPLPEPKKEVESLCKLMDIRIEYCGQLLYVFPSHMLPQNLQQLLIKECDELEVIFSKELKEKEAINNDIIVFPRLKEVGLWKLPKLKSFYTETQGCFFSHKVVFPVLKSMRFWKLDKITRIWDDQPLSEPEKEAKSFSELEDIDVDGCDQLEYVLPSYMLFQLKNLQELSIKNCTKVEVIISNNPKEKEATNNNDTIRFPQLKTLTLSSLPNLKSFIFSDQTQLLFSHKVIFPVLEWLNIDGLGSIIKIWDKQSVAVLEDQGSFSQLTNLEVKHCSKLMHVFPSNMHPLLKNLERLEVNECETMKGIAEFEGEIDEDGLRNEVVASLALEVEHLEMVGVPKITEIRGKQPLPEPKKEVESLCKLMDICIKNCGQLLYVFPSHMLPQNLQELEIEECDELEVIFSKDLKEEKEAINDDIIVFPRLKKVTLWTLPKLKSFYTETQGFFFAHKVVFPVLQHMLFWNLDKITRIWDDQPLSEPEKEAKSFSELQNIIVERCDQLEYVLPSYMLPQLKNLQFLNIERCRKVEVIILNNPKEKEATNNNDTIWFPQLKEVSLRWLPNLISFIRSDEMQLFFSNKVIFPVLKKLSIRKVHKIIEIWDKQLIAILEEQGSFCQLTDLDVAECEKLMHVFPSKMHSPLKNLKVLRVSDCPTMEGIVDFGGEIDEDGLRNEVCFSELSSLELSSLPNLESFSTKLGKAGTTEGNSTIHALPLFNGKVVFPVLKRVSIWTLDKITRIWDDQPLSEPEKEAKSFSELEDIDVYGCDKLEYVLPSYMLPQLKNLQELSIKSCTKVEVIISNNPKEKEATNNNDTIRFPQLKTLELWSLPNLKSFICSDETQSIFSNKVLFPVLKSLNFWNLDKITRIWDDQPLSEPEKEAKSFSEPEYIFVDGCDQLEYVLPSYMVPQLKNLQELKIWNCTKVEVIISNNPKEKEATNNNDTIRFPQLKEVYLKDLPNLKSFICSETQLFFSNKVAFPVLEEIDLDENSEILRDGTYTKEECSTSGEESDHNGEELDEDLETPTKEECGTSGKQNDHNGEQG